ncbi:AAA family ATPase [Parachitinimonas caeni]|uniref:ATP-binding protein n=1 Tax=Parachitinimonas caeni TaxID=3031301 RepID=A0ABT7DWL7_9NEIS|nr:ATP-binding protein [Parachitinimonas caeni]MDK2124458.1 ATP-binding protein [Parachitinimonas caeni]
MGAIETSSITAVPGIAQIGNLALCRVAVRRALDRNSSLPGMVVLHGPSGYGKTIAANYLANESRAFYVQAQSVWTRKAFLQAILREMSIRPAGTVCEMAELIAQELAASGRPLFIDEADHVVDRGYIELVRDLYEASHAPILLIGEELLPTKLQRYERVAGRVLAWVPAQPVNLEDAKKLRTIYAADVAIADDLLQRVVEVAHGSVRRVAVNLDLIQSEALNEGLERADLGWWGRRELYTGEAAKRRRL